MTLIERGRVFFGGRSTGWWAVALLLVGVIERAAIGLTYGPVDWGDSPSYMRLAGVIAKGGLHGYDGTRVPGYPALLALLGQSERSVWIAQMAMGLAISLLLLWMTARVTSRPGLGFAVGLSYDLAAGLVLFEFNILSETLSGFFLVAAMAVYLLIRPSRRMTTLILVTLALGLVASLAGMARTLFYFLPVWLLPFVWLAAGGDIKRRLAAIAGLSLPSVLILGGWIGFIYVHYDMLSPSTMSGYNLVQHTGRYFQYLPEQDATIRDTYIKYRDARIAERGVQTNAIWDAIPELSQKTGLSFFALSQKMEELSIQLILAHPTLYLHDVATGWIDFWKAPVYWTADAVHPASLVRLFSSWALITRGLALLANAAFLVISAAVILSRRARQRLGVDRFFWLVAGTIWLSSIVQTLVDHGDNPRFLIPLQMLVFLVVIVSAWRAARRPAKSAEGAI